MAKPKKQNHPLKLSEENSILQTRKKISSMHLSKYELKIRAIKEEQLAEKCKQMQKPKEAFYHDMLAILYSLEADDPMKAVAIADAGYLSAESDNLYFSYGRLLFNVLSECGYYESARRVANNMKRESKEVASQLEILARQYNEFKEEFEAKEKVAKERARKEEERTNEEY